jgi:hypothetical protein
MVVVSQQYETIPDLLIPLQQRRGAPPLTHRGLPHVQLDQWPPPEIARKLIEKTLRLPYVRWRQSRIASPETKALWIEDEFAAGPAEAFMDGHEFCYLHPPPASNIHVMLPRHVREPALQLGWGEPHPLTRLAGMPKPLVMLYAPRNSEELTTVMRLIWNSWEFACDTPGRPWEE